MDIDRSQTESLPHAQDPPLPPADFRDWDEAARALALAPPRLCRRFLGHLARHWAGSGRDLGELRALAEDEIAALERQS